MPDQVRHDGVRLFSCQVNKSIESHFLSVLKKEWFIRFLRTYIFEEVEMSYGGVLVLFPRSTPSFRRKPESRERVDILWISSLLYTSWRARETAPCTQV